MSDANEEKFELTKEGLQSFLEHQQNIITRFLQERMASAIDLNFENGAAFGLFLNTELKQEAPSAFKQLFDEKSTFELSHIYPPLPDDLQDTRNDMSKYLRDTKIDVNNFLRLATESIAQLGRFENALNAIDEDDYGQLHDLFERIRAKLYETEEVLMMYQERSPFYDTDSNEPS